jgi:hypothetical protein
VFDVLAALAHLLRPGQRIGMLGFAGGSVLAPLRYLAPGTPVEAVDLNSSGYELFQTHCSAWAGTLTWHQADAVRWLQRRRGTFPVLIDDLSVLAGRRVIKPEVSTQVLPGLMASKLAPQGVLISNLLRPPRGAWRACLTRFADVLPKVYQVCLDEFENRIVVAGRDVPCARELGRTLRRTLRLVQSRQADKVHVRSLG